MRGKTCASSHNNKPIPGFNEAPAECGGKLAVVGVPVGERQRASMRPPQNAGENIQNRIIIQCGSAGFNEAPAECGGKLGGLPVALVALRRFNEAPAECGGKRPCCRPTPPPTSSFNEAPAECGGKRAGHGVVSNRLHELQ